MYTRIDFKSILKLMRPKQWIKNLIIFAAIIFSGSLFKHGLFLNNIIVFILFSLTSSSIYILNDIVDIEKDKCHPDKKNRPLASGKVLRSQAYTLLFVLVIAILSVSLFYNNKIFIILLLYMLINILYSFIFKNIIILDVMIITLGFILRVESGSIISSKTVSPWLFLCTILLSLFLALNKRKSELITLDNKSSNHRKILEEYSIELIDKMLTIVNPSILMTYCLYTFISVQSKTMMFTIPFVLYGIFRYQYLMEKSNIGGKPEEVFMKDLPFLINIILWVLSVIIIIYFKL